MNLKSNLIIISLVFLLVLAITPPMVAENVKRDPRVNLKGMTGDNFISQIGVVFPFQNKDNSNWYTDIR